MAEKKERRQLRFRGVTDGFHLISLSICNMLDAAIDLGRTVYRGQKTCAYYEVLVGHQTGSRLGGHCHDLRKVRWVRGWNSKHCWLHPSRSHTPETQLRVTPQA